MTTIRLQVALAKAGVASRRKAAGIIAAGRVKVNGKVTGEKGARVDIKRDRITFDGKPLRFEKKKYYYILNKPSGVLSTVRDERGRKKVSDYVRAKGARLYPVGRLDKDTTGLIILTNDGDLTYRLTHPKFRVDRVYEARANGRMEKEKALRLTKGIAIEGGLARAEKVIFKERTPKFTVLTLSIREGKKREVRRMLEATGHKVSELKRIAYGSLHLGSLREGKARELSKTEVEKLKSCVGL